MAYEVAEGRLGYKLFDLIFEENGHDPARIVKLVKEAVAEWLDGTAAQAVRDTRAGGYAGGEGVRMAARLLREGKI